MEEKFKMGLDAQKSFAQMYEDRKMNKRIGGKMVKLNPIIIQEPRKETKTRKPQSPFKIRVRATISPVFSYGRS